MFRMDIRFIWGRLGLSGGIGRGLEFLFVWFYYLKMEYELGLFSWWVEVVWGFVWRILRLYLYLLSKKCCDLLVMFVTGIRGESSRLWVISVML